MFCKKCGKELEDNVRFCNYCGAEVESKVVDFNEAVGNNKPDNSYANAGGQKYNYEYVMPQQPVQAAAGQPVEEDVSINIAGHKIKGRLIMKIAAIVAAACFFFPMFTVSCAGVNVGSVSMADLTFETEDTTQESYYDYYDSDEEENGTVGMIVFLLAPVSVFADDATFKIGGIGPVTGAAAIYGQAVKNATELAINEVNEDGGINGYQVEFKFEDDENDAEKSLNAYNALKDWGMNILVGTVTSTPCVAVANETAADNMFQLTPSGSATECVANPNVFRVCFSDPNQGTAAAQYIGEHKLATKVAIIYDSSDVYSSGIYEKFAQ